MRTSLYDLSVPTFLQTVRSVGGFLDRAATHFSNTGVDPDNFVNTRLFDDMAPFHFQIEAACHHSVWGVEALKTGAFTPPALVGPVPFTDLQAMIGKAETALEAFVPEEINDCAGKHLDLQIGPRRLAFTSETFILSFSLPNFHFHAVTAYNILRSRGVPLGKRDYEVGCAPVHSEPKFGLQQKDHCQLEHRDHPPFMSSRPKGNKVADRELVRMGAQDG